jgi:predicted Zn-dependent protease
MAKGAAMLARDAHVQTLRDAMALGRAGRLGEAATLIETVLARHPRDADALQLRGLVARQRGDDAAAIADFRASLAIQPRQPMVLCNLGNALLATGDARAAHDRYAAALALVPDDPNALVHLAIACLALDRPGDALPPLRRLLAARPDHARAQALLARALRDCGELDAALAAFDDARRLGAGDAATLHDHAIALRLAGRPLDALADRALASTPRDAGLHLTRAHLLAETGDAPAAIAACRAAIALDPLLRGAHSALDHLLWTQDRHDEWGASYTAALAAHPDAHALRADRAHALTLAGRAEDAAALLETAAARADATPELLLRHAQSLWSSRRPDAAFAALSRALPLAPEWPPLVREAARLHLIVDRPADAMALLDPLLARDRFDQQALAYRAIGWRLLGDDRADTLTDADALVHETMLAPPDGDAAAFHARLADELRALHRARRQPIDQTLRGGTQTQGDLFAATTPAITTLRAMLAAAVSAWIAALPDDPAHPFLARKSGDFALSGAWSVLLATDGHHVPHIHPEGWISSVCYVALPDLAGDEGALVFGRSPLALGDRERETRRIRPAVGKLVLFPSYFYHGTLPFSASGERLTVAFDVVPSAQR